MLWSLSETLELIEPSVPCQLVSPAAFAHMKKTATVLPDTMSSYYLECRLSANKAQTDLLVCATVEDGGRDILAGDDATTDLSNLLLEHPLWSRLRDFSRQWAAPASPLYEQIALIWLEFDDVGRPLPSIPIPNFSFCLDPHYRRQRGQSLLDIQSCQHLTGVGAELLLGDALPTQTRQNLFACFDSLPAEGNIIHVSPMLARQPPELKLYGRVPQECLWEYLARIGWTGSSAELEILLTRFCTPATVDQNIYIDLTVGETVSPRIGIVFPQQQIEKLSHTDPKRKILLDLCVEDGLCTPEKHHALMNWPGSFRKTFPHESWPTRFNKWLDVKVVYEPKQAPEAKGYLGFAPRSSLF